MGQTVAMLKTKRLNQSSPPFARPPAELPIGLRAVIPTLLFSLVAINVWPLLLFKLGVPLAAFAEAIFLGLFLWWASGGGPPRSTRPARTTAFRRSNLSYRQWVWGLIAAFFFAATIHASMILLFRLVPFPVAAFRRGYDLSFIASRTLQWLAVVVSAISAGICEETLFRGYLQRPIERRGPTIAILISSLFFMALHLTKAWATPVMVPIVFGAGLLLGLLAWSSQSLIPGMIGHILMDIGLFAYWWTGIAGDFRASTIAVTGVDELFVLASVVFLTSLSIVLVATTTLRRIQSAPS